MFWIIVVLLISLIWFKLHKTYNYWIERNVKQRKQIYLLGDNGKVMLQKESFFDMVTSIYNSFPNERYIGMYQGLRPTLMIRDPELIKRITIKDFDHFTDHQQVVPDHMDPIWNKNLFGLKGEQWKQLRGTLSPSFTSSKMKMMFHLISDTAQTYLKYFENRNFEEGIELKELFTRYTNDVIASVAFGINVDSIHNKTNDFYMMGREALSFSFMRNMVLFAYILMPKISILLNLKLFPDHITNFFKKVISDTIKLREEKGIVRPDMIHLLLQARKEGHHLTDVDITSQAVIFFFGGFESVATLLTFMGYELVANSDIQKKLQAEIDETVRKCPDGKLTYETLMEMKYLDMVVSETLRKWPTLATDRICTKSYKIEPTNSSEKEITLDPDDVVWIPMSGIHRDPKYYPDPDKFDPERFSDENKHKINPSTYLPFGTGPRSCIGLRLALLEAKVVFFYTLRYFNIVPNAKTDIPVKIGKTYGFNAENGIWVNIEPKR